MEFSPNNPIVRMCLQGMAFEDRGEPAEAKGLFEKAWSEATNDLERFLAAFYLARGQAAARERLAWYETALRLAREIDDAAVAPAFAALYREIAACYGELDDTESARRNYEMAASFADEPVDEGPFYHGTKADLSVGDLLTPGGSSNYKDDLTMNHIYFTALVNGAGLAASLARGDAAERVYIVEPTGPFENDPNVTNNKFPGNLTRSYRSRAPLKVIGEVPDWARQSPEDLQNWRKKLAASKGEIIN